MNFTFIHAADIHLDSPLLGLASRSPELASVFHQASRRALTNLINEALTGSVDFVLIAGDLFDGELKDVGTALEFARGMGRLARAGIKVFAIWGNHDAQTAVSRSPTLPASMHIFGSKQAATVLLDELGVAVHGRSFGARATEQNLAASYPRPAAGLFNIALLHTSLSGREGHDVYAPCRLEELATAGMDYWALGHVHSAEICHERPHIVFPGNLQGRSIREAGAKGAMRVTVRDGVVQAVEPLILDAARFARVAVDAAETDDLEGLVGAAVEAAGPTIASAGALPLALRVEFTGPTSLHGQIALAQAPLEQALQTALLAYGQDIMVERVIVRTSPDSSALPNKLAEGFTLALQEAAADPTLRAKLADELRQLARGLPQELFRSGAEPPFDVDDLDQLMRLAGEAALKVAQKGRLDT